MKNGDFKLGISFQLLKDYLLNKAGLALNWGMGTICLDYSFLFLVGDGAGWALDEEMRELSCTARRLGIRVKPGRHLGGVHRQSVFFSNLDPLVRFSQRNNRCRLAASYFHGLPGRGEPVFDERYQWLCRRHELVQRLQVTNSAFRDVVLETGIAPEKLHLIPIGVNLDCFSPQSPQWRKAARDRYQLPQSAVIIGSFQKDGMGWQEGLEPKWIKGPDVFLKVVRRLYREVPELFVLLAGPARGYVKNGLEACGIPYRHIWAKDLSEIGQLYQCLDLYLVTSREEGGPKAVLEAMACGIPLVSTRVGQATDLVSHGIAGWLADVDDDEALAYWAHIALDDGNRTRRVLMAAREVAEANCYQAQSPLWVRFMNGFVKPRKQRA